MLPPPIPVLPEAPGARSARVCGILGIFFALTLVGIPVAFVLGIVALVKHSKAHRLARECPQGYRVPTASGMVLGIVSLVMPLPALAVGGIVAAIAVPALLGQQGRAHIGACRNNLQSQLSELVLDYEASTGAGLDQAAVHASLERHLHAAPGRNPWNMQAPAFRPGIARVAAQSKDQALARAEGKATEKGEVVFVVAYSADPAKPGYLAGAVKVETPSGGVSVISKAVELD